MFGGFISYHDLFVFFGNVDVFFQRFNVVKMQSDSEDYELKQMRDMAAAKKRWDSLVGTQCLFILNCIAF